VIFGSFDEEDHSDLSGKARTSVYNLFIRIPDAILALMLRYLQYEICKIKIDQAPTREDPPPQRQGMPEVKARARRPFVNVNVWIPKTMTKDESLFRSIRAKAD